MTTKTNKNLKKFVALGLGLSLLASIGIGAYLTDTDTKSDVYTVGNVQAEIIANGDMEVANAGYLLPGTTHVYERAASNVGINDAYVFMSVTIPYETIGVADDNGTQLGEKVMQLFAPVEISSEWKLVDDGFIGEYAIAANGQTAGEHDAYSAIAGDTITYVYGYVGDNADGALKALASGETTSNLVKEMKLTNLYNASKITGEISTKLYAIQSNHVNGGLTDVNGVWAVINTALVGNEAAGEDQVVAEDHAIVSGMNFKSIVCRSFTTDAVTSTEFVAGKPASANAADVSEAQDGSVMAWVEDTTLYVSAIDGGKIVANDTYQMFRDDFPNIQSVNFENLEIQSIGDNMFSGCSTLTSIVLPDNITSIENSAFYGCTGLTELTIPASVTTIGNSAFFNCTNLTTVFFEEGSKLETIEMGAFYQTGLTSIVLPEGVKTIGMMAFQNSNNLVEVSIPSSVTLISSQAFACPELRTINFAGTEDQWNSITKENNWNRTVPADCVINFLGE